MRQRIGILLLAAAILGAAPAPVALAQATGQAGASTALSNQIEGLEVAEHGGTLYVRLTLKEALPALPPNFSIANPARIAFDFAGTANALGRTVQTIEQGDLRSANIVQVGDRTRLVLNLVRPSPYEARLEGRDLVVAIAPPQLQAAPPSAPAAAAQASFAPPRAAVAAGVAVRDINFRRGAEGEGRVVIDLSSPDAGIDIRQQGSQLVVDLLNASLPESLRRRSDVTDFATPITSMTAQQVGDRVRLTVVPNGLWEHNAYQSDTRFVLEVKRIIEDPNKLVQGSRGQHQGDKLSLNFQNIDVRSVLQVIADFTDFNIITSDSVQGNITLRLKDVPWDQALDIILQSKGLDMRKSGNVIWIAPQEELAAREKMQLEARAQVGDLEPLQTESFQINYHKAREIFAFLKSKDQTVLSKRGSVVFDERSNKVFVTDVGGRLTDIRRVIREIDVPPRQVLIEARVVEASKSFVRELGVRLQFGNSKPWSMNNGGANVGFGASSVSTASGGTNTFTPGVAQSGTGYQPEGYGSFGLSIFNGDLTRFLNLELQALESDGRGRVISSPRVLTVNQIEATIKQGTQIPIPVPGRENAEPTVEYKDAVLSLKVRPTITPDGRVQMAVEVNKDRPDFSRTVLGRPSIDTRSVATEVTVDNGGTLVIGGVYEEEEATSVDRVPVLGELPLLGGLFRTTGTNSVRRELLIFITPRIVAESLALR